MTLCSLDLVPIHLNGSFNAVPPVGSTLLSEMIRQYPWSKSPHFRLWIVNGCCALLLQQFPWTLLCLSPSLHYVTLLSLCFPLVPLVHLGAGHPTLPLHATI